MANTVTNDTGLWIMAILAASAMGAEEQCARAIVQEAALHHPNIVELLKSLSTDMPGPPLPDDLLSWVTQEATDAENYEPPPPHFLHANELEDHP